MSEPVNPLGLVRNVVVNQKYGVSLIIKTAGITAERRAENALFVDQKVTVVGKDFLIVQWKQPLLVKTIIIYACHKIKMQEKSDKHLSINHKKMLSPSSSQVFFWKVYKKEIRLI